jgi:hypothetical protein
MYLNGKETIMKDADGELVIEPCASETNPWDGTTYAVYRYDVWPESSVLAGQPRRSFVDSSEDLEQLKREHPDAEVTEGTGYTPPPVPETPPSWFDPTLAGERWNNDY